MTTPPVKSTPAPATQNASLISKLSRASQLPEQVVEHRWTPRLLMLAIGVSWGILLSSGSTLDLEDFEVGEIAPRTVRSSTLLVVEDAEATEQARQAAVVNVLPVVNHLANLPGNLQQQISNAFEILRRPDLPPDEQKRKAEEALGSPLTEAQFKMLSGKWDTISFELKVKEVLRSVYSSRIVNDPERWSVAYPNGVMVRSGQGESLQTRAMEPSEFRQLVGVPEALELAEQRTRDRFPTISRAERQLMMDLLKVLVTPNYLANPIETEAEKARAGESVKPVFFQLKAGEVVVRSGERVTPAHIKQLTVIRDYEALPQVRIEQLAKIAMIVFAVFLLMPYSAAPGWRKLGHPQDLFFTLVVSSIFLGIVRVGWLLAEPLVFALPDLPRESILLVLPFAALSMIFRMFFRPKIAFRVTVLFAFAVSIFLEPILLILPYTLLGSAVGMQTLKHSRTRSQFQRAGMFVGLTQAGVWLIYSLFDSSTPLEQVIRAVPFAVIGGFIAAVLTATMMPLGEWIGRYVSEARLLELAQDDQPLLKWLHLNAPGTYNHSISVGRLAESAAERINADALLARVGAYYHDIGKGFWPQYFVENQRGENPHDKLKPQLSARVIIAHVTHGVELARKNNLPPIIIDFIAEHHGTSRVEYFFRQAQEQEQEKEDFSDDTVFRYPGPRPQTKETALVMLADVVESATRTLEAPTPDRIRAFVARLVEKVYADQQLDDSPLTMNDLSVTVQAFTDVLAGMFHHRIDYPLGLKPGQKPVDERASATQS